MNVTFSDEDNENAVTLALIDHGDGSLEIKAKYELEIMHLKDSKSPHLELLHDFVQHLLDPKNNPIRITKQDTPKSAEKEKSLTKSQVSAKASILNNPDGEA